MVSTGQLERIMSGEHWSVREDNDLTIRTVFVDGVWVLFIFLIFLLYIFSVVFLDTRPVLWVFYINVVQYFCNFIVFAILNKNYI